MGGAPRAVLDLAGPDGGPRAVLDFPGPDGAPRREIFRNPAAIIVARELTEVSAALGEVEAWARSGHHVLGFVAYDAAPAFEPAFAIRGGYEGPLAWFAAFRESDRFAARVGGAASWPSAPTESGSPAPTESGPPAPSESGPPAFAEPWSTASTESWTTALDPAAYRQSIEQIIAGIEAGDFYQVNFTDRFQALVADPLAVYERVRMAQRAGYAAFIDTGEMVVASASPELFVKRTGDTLESRPMKGTSRRGRWSAEDDALAQRLASSEKERAENVMIVDLIRNDLGRISRPGSVEVDSLFDIERFPTVLQMTSHVKSQITGTTSLVDVFRALFPCGSVTGAPKIAASKAIATLEASPRGVYCGAVGVVRPGGDFTFNVAIRTIAVRGGHATYGAGGGITADSDPGRELAELETKAQVLTALPREVSLIETMRAMGGVACRLDRHLRRLQDSARYFSFRDPGASCAAVRDRLIAAARTLPANEAHRLRVVLHPDGSHDLTTAPLPVANEPRVVRLSGLPVNSGDPAWYHKTSDRARYADRLAAAGSDTDDVILVNERGELTETTIGNLVLEIGGRRVTPPLASGLLPGIYREELIEAGEIEEQVLYPTDLARASRIWMVNSLRGWLACRVLA